MPKTLLTGLMLLLPATAFAQAPAAPKPAEPAKPAAPKPAEAAKPAAPKPAEPAKPAAAKPAEAPKPAETKPAEAAKPVEAAKPAEAKPAEAPKPAETKPAEAAKPADASAAGPAGPGASTDAQATGTTSLTLVPTVPPAADAGAPSGVAQRPANAPPSAVARQSALSWEEAEAQWKFSYHGYLRAPMRVGVGKRLPEDTNGYTIGNQTDMTLHEAAIPDDQYLSFQSTSHNMRSWAEGFFGFGNGTATGVIGIGSYNITEGGFNDFEANWGISQAYVLLTPDLGYENVRIWAKAGSVVDRYGMSGRYDAGEYDTYMFGRTHVIGETFHVDYDINDLWTLSLEQGFGTHKPDPNQYNSARYTLLHHEHVSLKQGRDLEFGAHYLMSWSMEEFRTPDPTAQPGAGDRAPRNGLPNGRLWVAGLEARAELGAFGYIYGAYSHVGANYATTVSRAIEVLHSSGGGEFNLGVIGNYLESPECSNTPPETPPAAYTPGQPPPPFWQPLDMDACSDGNGDLNALHGQYEFSLTNFQQQISGGQRFWGQGFDTVLKLYGMVVFVNSHARDTTKGPKTGGPAALDAADLPNRYKPTKSKFGADLTVQALPWLSPALRFDRVNPNSLLPDQGFSILSPRLQFKTAWVTHERITLGYSRYFYDERVCEPRVPESAAFPDSGTGTKPDARVDPLAAYRCVQAPPSPVPYDGYGTTYGKQRTGTRASTVDRPDENVFKIEATMWW